MYFRYVKKSLLDSLVPPRPPPQQYRVECRPSIGVFEFDFEFELWSIVMMMMMFSLSPLERGYTISLVLLILQVSVVVLASY
jgi:hypothetical protein